MIQKKSKKLNSKQNPKEDVGESSLAHQLANLIYDGQFDTIHRSVLTALHEIGTVKPDGLTSFERSRLAYHQLREVSRRLGPAKELVADPSRLLALFEWAAALVPDLFTTLSGH